MFFYRSSMRQFWWNQQPLVTVWYSIKKLSGTSYLYCAGRRRWLMFIVIIDCCIYHTKFNLHRLDQNSNIISISFCSSLQKFNAVFRVMTVMVSDVQLIRIRWYYPSLLFSQSHKFKNDWRFWSHPVSVFSQSCKSKNDWDSDLTHSKPWYNQSKKNIFLVLWKLFGLLEILMPQNTMLLLYISRWTGWLCYGRMKQILSNSQLAMPIWHPLYHRKYSVGNLQ